MSFWQWLRSLFASTPKYDPADDPVVQELHQHARRMRHQTQVLRTARITGRPASFEEMFGRLPNGDGGSGE